MVPTTCSPCGRWPLTPRRGGRGGRRWARKTSPSISALYVRATLASPRTGRRRTEKRTYCLLRNGTVREEMREDWGSVLYACAGSVEEALALNRCQCSKSTLLCQLNEFLQRHTGCITQG